MLSGIRWLKFLSIYFFPLLINKKYILKIQFLFVVWMGSIIVLLVAGTSFLFYLFLCFVFEIERYTFNVQTTIIFKMSLFWFCRGTQNMETCSVWCTMYSGRCTKYFVFMFVMRPNDDEEWENKWKMFMIYATDAFNTFQPFRDVCKQVLCIVCTGWRPGRNLYTHFQIHRPNNISIN